MCHCHDKSCFAPGGCKDLKEKNEKGIHPDPLLDLREEAAQEKSGQGRNFPFGIFTSYRF